MAGSVLMFAPGYDVPQRVPDFLVDARKSAGWYLADDDIGPSGPGAAQAFAGVLATLRRGVRSTCIGMISDSTGDDKNAGTPVDEWPRVLVKKLGAAFPVYTVEEKNWNDAAQGYDPVATLQVGTGNGGGARGVAFTKAAPGSMQYPSTTTGPSALDVQEYITPTSWTDPADRTVQCKWESGTNQRSYLSC